MDSWDIRALRMEGVVGRDIADVREEREEVM